MIADYFTIDTNNLRILAINSNNNQYNDILNVYEYIFNNNFIDIITRNKQNTIFNILYKSINKLKYNYIRIKIIKYLRRKNIKLNFYKILDMFFNKDDLFETFIDINKLIQLIELYANNNKLLDLLNINDYIFIHKFKNYNFYIKWKINYE